MVKFSFLEKSLGLVSLPHFEYDLMHDQKVKTQTHVF